MINAGFTIATVNSDIDGQTRPIGAAYDIGADEWIATVNISGFVRTAGGNGIRNVTVALSGGLLPQPLFVQTGSLGSFNFANIPTGQTYTVSISSKRYTFTPPSIAITPYTDLVLTNFVSNEQITGGGKRQTIETPEEPPQQP